MDFQNCDYHRDYDFYMNALYDSREDATKKQTEFYLSPYGPTCFQYMLRQGTEGGYMEITVSRRYGTFCAFLLIQNSITVSHSVSFLASSSSPFRTGCFFSPLPHAQSQPIQRLLLFHRSLSLRPLRHSPHPLLRYQAIRLQQRRDGRRSRHILGRPHFLLPPLVPDVHLEVRRGTLPISVRLHGRFRVYRRAARPNESVFGAASAAHVAVRHGSLGIESDFLHADHEFDGVGDVLAAVLPRFLRPDEENQRNHFAIVRFDRVCEVQMEQALRSEACLSLRERIRSELPEIHDSGDPEASAEADRESRADSSLEMPQTDFVAVFAHWNGHYRHCRTATGYSVESFAAGEREDDKGNRGAAEETRHTRSCVSAEE